MPKITASGIGRDFAKAGIAAAGVLGSAAVSDNVGVAQTDAGNITKVVIGGVAYSAMDGMIKYLPLGVMIEGAIELATKYVVRR